MSNQKFKNCNTIGVPLTNLGNLWRSLEVPLINCKVQLNLRQIKYCVQFPAPSDNDSVTSFNYFSVLNTKNYIPAVTFSAKDNQKL